MARADTFCSQGRGNRLCAWQVQEQHQVIGHEPRPDARTALVRAIRSHFAWPGACTACPCCLHVLCTCLRVPCLRLCVCHPACVGRYRAPATTCSACMGPLCSTALHLFARAFAVPARVLPRACFFCTWSFPQLQLRPLGGDPPSQSWARGVDTYDWRAAASNLVDLVLTAIISMHRRDFTPILPPTQHLYMQPPYTTHSHLTHDMSANLIKLFS